MNMKYLVMVFILVLASCTPAEQPTLKVGVLATLSGPAAIFGNSIVEGAELAVSELNANGANIELIIEDNKNDPKEGINAYHRMRLEKPDVIFTTMSGASAAMIPLAEEDGIPVVTSLTYANFQEHENVYQYYQSTEDLAAQALDFMVEEEVKSVGLLTMNIEAGQALMLTAEELFTDAGINVVGVEYYAPSDLDRRTSIMKLTAEEPDALYVFDLRPDQMIPQVAQLYDGIIVTTETPAMLQHFKDIAELDGLYLATPSIAVPGTVDNAQFVELFGNTEPIAAYGYDVIHIIWEGQKNMPGSIVELGTYNGLLGEVDLESRKPSIPLQMVQIQNKTLVPVR